MTIDGIILKPLKEECPYRGGMISMNETLFIKELDDQDLEILLSRGFRHFGEVFFRPICGHCSSCIPIRIPVQRFVPSRSVKRLLKRNRHLTVTLEKPEPTVESFALYKKHKKRFKRQDVESYNLYVKSFFYPFKFNYMLLIKDGNRLVALSHLDIAARAMSAVYTYFDESYSRFSPGKFAVYTEIEMARELGIQWLYLGYYVQQNRHMNYKIQFKPNQLMHEDYIWLDYMDAAGNALTPLPQPCFQTLVDYKQF